MSQPALRLPTGPSTIDDVVARFDAVLDRAERERDRVGYFAALYRRFTVLLRDAMAAGEFLDRDRFERVDVAFATRYFAALDAFRSGGALTESWRVAFAACARPELTILQHLYAGLAAHQLLDLPIAASEEAPGPLISDFASDFEHVNAVVGKATRAVNAIMGRLSPRIGWLDRTAPQVHAAANRLGIFASRSVAWRAALRLAPLDDGPRATRIAVMDRRVARVARAILEPRGPVRLVPWFVRRAEETDVRRVIRVLSGREA